MDKWKDHEDAVDTPYQKDNRLYVNLRRPYRQIETFLKAELPHLRLGKQLDEIIKDHYEIVDVSALIIPSLAVFWTQFLDGKQPWER